MKLQTSSESTFKVAIGLVMLWLSLVLLFKAHTLSNPFILTGLPGDKSAAASQDLRSRTDNRDKLMHPITISWHDSPRRQTLASIAEQAGFVLIADPVADRIPTDRPTIRLHQVSLARTIHHLLGNPELGFALRGRDLLIFPQQLDVTRVDGQVHSLRWSAELTLADQPLLISPTEINDLRFSIRIAQPPPTSSAQPSVVAVELWDGTDSLEMSQTALDQQGHGHVRLTVTGKSIGLWIDRLSGPQSDRQSSRYRLRLEYKPLARHTGRRWTPDSSDPGFDPAVILLAGAGRPRFSVSILSRNYVALFSPLQRALLCPRASAWLLDWASAFLLINELPGQNTRNVQ